MQRKPFGKVSVVTNSVLAGGVLFSIIVPGFLSDIHKQSFTVSLGYAMMMFGVLSGTAAFLLVVRGLKHLISSRGRWAGQGDFWTGQMVPMTGLVLFILALAALLKFPRGFVGAFLLAFMASALVSSVLLQAVSLIVAFLASQVRGVLVRAGVVVFVVGKAISLALAIYRR